MYVSPKSRTHRRSRSGCVDRRDSPKDPITQCLKEDRFVEWPRFVFIGTTLPDCGSSVAALSPSATTKAWRRRSPPELPPRGSAPPSAEGHPQTLASRPYTAHLRQSRPRSARLARPGHQANSVPADCEAFPHQNSELPIPKCLRFLLLAIRLIEHGEFFERVSVSVAGNLLRDRYALFPLDFGDVSFFAQEAVLQGNSCGPPCRQSPGTPSGSGRSRWPCCSPSA